MTENLHAACDLLVVGSGAAGLAAAISAHHHGLKPAIIEKAETFGGSTAVSGGAIWVPCNSLMKAAGLEDSRERAEVYVRSLAGRHLNTELLDVFLDRGAEAISFFNEATALKVHHRQASPDYHSDMFGASEGGRVLDALEYDGRRLGRNLARLRAPIQEFTILGGMPLSRQDIYHFMRLTRSVASTRHVIRVVLHYMYDRLTWGQSTRLVMGGRSPVG